MKILDFPSTTRTRVLAEKYGYDEFIVRRWFKFFGEDTIKIMETFEEGLPKYIRVNTIKIPEKELIKRLEVRGFRVDPTDIPYCYMVSNEPYSIGATPEYLMGYYYIMDKSSCVPPLVLAPKPGDLVVDLAASPGGKTTFLSMLMQNKGTVLAVEPQKERLQPLIDNVHRMGAMNVAVLNMDGRSIGKIREKVVGGVDKVLLDAPCTGEGIIHKDPSRKTDRDAKDLSFCSYLQKELILAAYDILKDGGELVYSTCSMAPEENEIVVDFLLEMRENVEVVEVEYGVEGLTIPELDLKWPEEIKKTRRLFPHIHRCSGFFIARIRKV
ncbi:NOL1/NOP2/sun family putative RNA methylase [Archaeoglobus neptunius]|uniref:NOL1/NOP2/sun family putative RNA methylase n=1 Tax=Archaeoglobus neptunius TaxID=2798580 RepID=UPI0019264022|nr:NOL1/NOP2/sun family putative RNA methylase [Archaeoglobus neptunius]